MRVKSVMAMAFKERGRMGVSYDMAFHNAISAAE